MFFSDSTKYDIVVILVFFSELFDGYSIRGSMRKFFYSFLVGTACMAYRTLDRRYTLPYIPIRILHHMKVQTLFTISSHHCHLAFYLLTVELYSLQLLYLWFYDPIAANATILILPLREY